MSRATQVLRVGRQLAQVCGALPAAMQRGMLRPGGSRTKDIEGGISISC